MEVDELCTVALSFIYTVKKECKEGDHYMKIHLLIFITSVHEKAETTRQEMMMKSFESDIRPVKGDIIDDPGFHSGFHNGYEIVKVTISYASNECFVSLTPLVQDHEEITVGIYIEKLEANGWRIVSKEELNSL